MTTDARSTETILCYNLSILYILPKPYIQPILNTANTTYICYALISYYNRF